MDVARLCHVCGKTSRNTCSMCGRPACDTHFDSELGMCVECKKGRR